MDHTFFPMICFFWKLYTDNVCSLNWCSQFPWKRKPLLNLCSFHLLNIWHKLQWDEESHYFHCSYFSTQIWLKSLSCWWIFLVFAFSDKDIRTIWQYCIYQHCLCFHSQRFQNSPCCPFHATSCKCRCEWKKKKSFGKKKHWYFYLRQIIVQTWWDFNTQHLIKIRVIVYFKPKSLKSSKLVVNKQK